MNVRETRKALEECRKAGNNGNGGLLGKSGKRNRSTLAPVIQGAVLAKRANGANKAQIARDLKISHNTVDKILDETEFDAQIAEGRSKAVGLIPEALGGLKVAFAKGDGATSCRFLEGMNVLGVQNDRPGKPDSDIHLMQSIQMLIRPETPVITVEAQTVEPSSK